MFKNIPINLINEWQKRVMPTEFYGKILTYSASSHNAKILADAILIMNKSLQTNNVLVLTKEMLNYIYNELIAELSTNLTKSENNDYILVSNLIHEFIILAKLQYYKNKLISFENKKLEELSKDNLSSRIKYSNEQPWFFFRNNQKSITASFLFLLSATLYKSGQYLMNYEKNEKLYSSDKTQESVIKYLLGLSLISTAFGTGYLYRKINGQVNVDSKIEKLNKKIDENQEELEGINKLLKRKSL